MELLKAIEQSQIVFRLGWALLHTLWLGAALAAVLAMTLLILRRRSSNARYLAACVALVMMFALPAATFFLVPAPAKPAHVDKPDTIQQPSAVSLTKAPVADATVEPIEPLPHRRETVLPAKADDAAPAVAAAKETPAAETPQPPMLTKASRALEPALPWVVLAWVAGVFVLSLRQLCGWVVAERLKRLATQPAETDLIATVVRLARAMRVSRPVKVLESVLVRVPSVVGWLRPVILLPAGLATGLTPQQLQAILAHELAHIRRYDYLVNLLQSLIETLLFYHPAVWFISRRIRAERENCCDDIAVAAGAERFSYAESLLHVAQRSLAARRGRRFASSTAALGATGGQKPSQLRSRIARLLTGQAEETTRLSRSWPIAMIFLVAALVTACLFVTVNAEPAGPLDKPETPATQPVRDAPDENTREAFKFNSKANLKVYAKYNISNNKNIPRQREIGFTPAAEPLVIPAVRTSWNLAFVGEKHSVELRKLVRELNGPHGLPEFPRIWMNINTTDADLKEVARLAELKHLDLLACHKITDAGLAYIGNMKQLEQISLPSSITDAGLAHVANLTELKDLYLHTCNRVTDEGLAYVAKLNRLERITLQDCGGITDAGFAHIAKIRGIKGLSLIGSVAITNDGLRHISKLEKLNTLYLSDCDSITDDGLVHIAKMKELSSLSLSGYITDAGLQHIAGLPKLFRLDLGKHGTISDKMASKLIKAARPGFEIGRLAKSPAIYCSFKGPLEFGKSISIDKKTHIGSFHRELYTHEGKWVRDERATSSVGGSSFKVMSIRFHKSWFNKKLTATVKPLAILGKSRWQLTVRLLDAEGKVVAQATSTIDSEEFYRAKKREIALSLGRWRGDVAKATTFDLLVMPLPEKDTTTQPVTQPAEEDLDATAKMLAKKVGGTWELDLHNAFSPNIRIIRGRVPGAGNSRQLFDVFPFAADDPRRLTVLRAYEKSNAQVIGLDDRLIVLKASLLEPRTDAAVASALGLKPVVLTPAQVLRQMLAPATPPATQPVADLTKPTGATLERWLKGKEVVEVCFAGAHMELLKLRDSLKIKVSDNDWDFRLAQKYREDFLVTPT